MKEEGLITEDFIIGGMAREDTIMSKGREVSSKGDVMDGLNKEKGEMREELLQLTMHLFTLLLILSLGAKRWQGAPLPQGKPTQDRLIR